MLTQAQSEAIDLRQLQRAQDAAIQALATVETCSLASKEWPIAIAAIFAYLLFAIALSFFVYIYRKQVCRHHLIVGSL